MSTLQSIEEEFAAMEHKRWAKWQKYMHSKMSQQFITSWGENGFVLPAELWNRWERQIATPYAELSEEEKESDREQVRPYLEALNQTAEKVRAEELNKQHSLIVLCSEVIGALSCHNEKSAKEYRERLKSLDEAKVIISKICL